MSGHETSPLPPGWTTTTLGQVASLIRGVTYKKAQAAKEPGPDLIPLLRATNIGQSLILDKDLVFVPSEVVSEGQKLLKNDIVVAASSGSLRVVGKSARLSTTWDGTFGAFCSVVRPLPSIAPAYLYWFMQTDFYRWRVSRLAAGSNINNLRREHLETMPVLLPPRAEQDRIVAVVESAMAAVDEAGREARSAARKAQVLQTSLLDDLLTEGDPCTLGELLDGIEAGKSFRCETRSAADDEWGIIKVSAMTWGEFDEDENKALSNRSQVNAAWEVRPGDILVSRANTTDYVGASVMVGECRPRLLLSDKSLRLRPAVGVDPSWLQQAISTRFARAQISRLATGTKDSMRNISQSKLRSINLRRPSLQCQKELDREATRICESMVELISAVDAQ